MHAYALSHTEKRLLNEFQHSFPLTTTPYADIAKTLDISEQEVLQTLEKLQQQGFISRIGAVFTPHRVGASSLVAMAIPENQLQQVANLVSRYDEVNHNYEREHHFNLWFVITGRDEQHLYNVLQDIETNTGYPVMPLPMLDDYHIDLGFDLKWT